MHTLCMILELYVINDDRAKTKEDDKIFKKQGWNARVITYYRYQHYL